MSDMFRVLRVIASLDPAFGGPVAGLAASVTEMARRGIATDIVVSDSEPRTNLIPENPRVRTYYFGSGLTRWRYNPSLFRWLSAHIGGYDMVIVHGIWPYASYATWKAARNSDSSYFLFTHGGLDPWYRRRQPVHYLRKWVTWPWAQYRVMRDAERVLFTTALEMDLAATSFRPYTCRGVVVRYGLANPPFDPPPLAEDNSDPYLLYLGRLHPKKGLEVLIEAIALLPECDRLQVVVAGSGSANYCQALRNRASGLGVADCLSWVGHVDGAEKWSLVRQARALVLPSHTENFGVVVAEALSCGTPALITDKVNIAPSVKRFGAGMVSADDVQGVTEMLREFALLSAADYQMMSQRAKRLFEADFTVSGAVDDLVSLGKLQTQEGR